MQWTQELNALLNQCVFASSYDFIASSELFNQQAAKMRLWTGEVLTASECQEQWLVLNPTEEEEEQEQEQEESPELEDRKERQEAKQTGPRLELTLSDAELDLLLSTLPPSEEPGDGSTADTKHRTHGRSEMQWVLAFLTDPDAIASVDVEAKNLVGSPDQNDDDNYQFFLQDLHDANLIAPASLGVANRHSQGQQRALVEDVEDGEDSSDAEAEQEWERTRQTMKQSKKSR